MTVKWLRTQRVKQAPGKLFFSVFLQQTPNRYIVSTTFAVHVKILIVRKEKYAYILVILYLSKVALEIPK